VQVIDAYYELNAAEAMIKTKKAAFASAQENFRIVRRKYEENLVLLVEFLDARVQFTNAQIDLIIANYDVLVKKAELERTLAL
ncbi:MAG: TolC family protein, partial [Bacteroidota bacterium]